MTDAQAGWGPAACWYPEIVEAGGADRAWQAEFDRRGAAVRVRRRDSADHWRAASAENEDLRAQLLLSPWERRFYLALRAGRGTLLQGCPVDLATAAAAADRWLSGQRPGQIAATWPVLGSVALAEARERGDHREASWLWLYENHCADPVGTRLAAFVAVAFHEPRLRALRPYTSHGSLCFSDTPQWPFGGAGPVIVPAEASGRYLVHTRDGRAHDEADAADALLLVLADLPDGSRSGRRRG